MSHADHAEIEPGGDAPITIRSLSGTSPPTRRHMRDASIRAAPCPARERVLGGGAGRDERARDERQVERASASLRSTCTPAKFGRVSEVGTDRKRRQMFRLVYPASSLTPRETVSKILQPACPTCSMPEPACAPLHHAPFVAPRDTGASTSDGRNVRAPISHFGDAANGHIHPSIAGLGGAGNRPRAHVTVHRRGAHPAPLPALVCALPDASPRFLRGPTEPAAVRDGDDGRAPPTLRHALLTRSARVGLRAVLHVPGKPSQASDPIRERVLRAGAPALGLHAHSSGTGRVRGFAHVLAWTYRADS
ncbi:hypothetical protein OBBRIDRAFT_837424 [Obba rivulosa]|uniref:Uncharacterized protein n=1 Tax=Obba rivulosa TaxID=1052685 RepID=A0A8E2AQ84_9APHY|nr:hypothetical protein OBBRIDRAFT_837424 [Obba rivulosa]